MVLPSTRLRRIPLLGRVVKLPYVGPLIKRLVNRFPWRGLRYGVLAFVLGYGLLFAVVVLASPSVPGFVDFLTDVLGVSLPGPGLLAGWVFYNAHGIDIRVPTTFSSETRNFLAEGSARLLFLYPPLVLLAVGAVAARTKRTLRSGALAGASLTAGYAPLLIFVAGLLTYEANLGLRTVTVQVVVDSSLYTTALAYPLVFGAIGGLLAARYDLPVLSRF